MAQNMFANAKNFRELELQHMMASSPENVAMDGERSNSEIQAAYRRIKEDFVARRNELILGK
jgi:hypothetical protein